MKSNGVELFTSSFFKSRSDDTLFFCEACPVGPADRTGVRRRKCLCVSVWVCGQLIFLFM